MTPHHLGYVDGLAARRGCAGPAEVETSVGDAGAARLAAAGRGRRRGCPVGDVRCTGTTDDNAFFGEGIADALQAVR